MLKISWSTSNAIPVVAVLYRGLKIGNGLVIILTAIFLASTCLGANSISLTNSTATPQNGQPFTIFRVFKQGEILNYPHPRAAGIPLAVWQGNVMTRWPDGSVQQSLISFALTLSANGSGTVDFINDSKPCHVGDQTACDNAAPSQTQILAFNLGNWGASIETRNAGVLQSANARTMIQNGNWRFWIRGPIANIIIAEDRSAGVKYDFGWHCASGCAPAGAVSDFFGYSTSNWTADPTNHSLHPIFVLTQYTGWPGVKVEYILENDWMTSIQDQKYDLTLKSASDLSVVQFNKSALVQIARSRWRKTFWDGQAPGRVNIDYNLRYLIDTKALPSYDTSRVVSAKALNAEIDEWNKSDQADIANPGSLYSGSVSKLFPATGARPDIGLIPQWGVLYLFTMNPVLYQAVIGNAEAMAYAPNHYRESTAPRYFDDLHTTNAFGRTVSADARPGFVSRDVLDKGLSYVADRPVVVGGVSRNYWDSMDVAHQPDPMYLAYLLTGDWYFLEETYFWASYNLTSGTPALLPCAWCRHDAWAFLNDALGNTRGTAWTMRTVAHAAWLAPDGSPEKTYFRQKLEYNFAVREGIMNITDGNFTGDPRWTWGRNVVAEGRPDPLGWVAHNLGFALAQASTIVDPTKACFIEGPWQQNYLNISWGHIEELGFSKIIPVRHASGKNLLHMILDPSYSPKSLLGVYYVGTRGFASDCSTSAPLTTWPQVINTITPLELGQAQVRWTAGASDAMGGYPTIAFGASSFLVGITEGSYSGADAWTWMKAHVANQGTLNDNPMWAFVPRGTSTGNNTGSACDQNSDGSVNIIDVQIAINQAIGVTACQNIDQLCNVNDVQRIINAALGQACVTGP